MRSFLICSLHGPLLFIRQIVTSVADIAVEITVAIATPATSRRNPFTKTTFSTTFTKPETIRK